MEITTTLTQKGRINVLVDGEYQFTVSSLFWRLNGCAEHADLTPDALAALADAVLAEAAYEKALRVLDLRAHGERELLHKLCRDYPREAAEAALERCRENRLVDDVSFAAAYAETLFRKKGWAPGRIEAALREKGIDREIAKNAVFALDIDRKNGIINIIKKMRLPERITKKDRQRLIRRLLAAGYTMGEIRETVSFSGGEEDPPAEI